MARKLHGVLAHFREDHAMQLPSTTPSQTRRLRAAAPVHGGASSMIRLSRAASPKLPSGASLSLWAARASVALHAAR